MRIQEATGKIKVFHRSYDGKLHTYDLVREAGTSIRIGGTASTSVFHCPVAMIGLYRAEESNVELADVVLPNNQNMVGVRTLCGVGPRPILLETIDIHERRRWILVPHLPKYYMRHFINCDIIKDNQRIRRLRIDPFFGESKIIDV